MAAVCSNNVTANVDWRTIALRIAAALAVNVLITVLALATANYSIDAYGWFGPSYLQAQRTRYVAALVADLLEPTHECVAPVEVTKGDLLASYLPLVDPSAIEVVHLGSSLQYVAGEELVAGGREFLNACTTASFLPDMVGTYELVRQSGVSPQTVVIGVDAWAFTELSPLEHGIRRLQPWIIEGYRRMEVEIGPEVAQHFRGEKAPASTATTLRWLLDCDYARYNTRLWLGELLNPASRPRVGLTYGRDLSLLSWPKSRSRNIDTEALGLQKSVLSEARFADFGRFLELIARDGATCELVLSPLNPKFLGDAELRRMRGEIEDQLRGLGKRRGLVVRGAYDPAEVGLGPEDFFDYAHPHRGAYRAIFEYRRDDANAGS
jgi:hypothetical protein